MKRLIIIVTALTFLLALLAPLTSANTTAPETVAQEVSPEEAAAYKAWYDANAAKDYPKAMELAKAYLDKFPSGKNADYLKNKWLPQMRGYFFQEAAKAKNIPEIIRIAKEVLAGDPENLDYIWAVVVQIRTNELSATPPNFAHANEAADFAQRAIKLFEAGKTLTGVDTKTFNKNVTLGFLHQTVAIVYDHEKNLDKALAEYEKAGALDPANEAYFFHCGRIHNDRYTAAAQKYDPLQKKSEDLQKKLQAIPEADRTAADPKPEVKSLLAEAKAAEEAEKAALAEVNNQADAVITCWTKFLGLTAVNNKWGDTRDKVKQATTDLYKYRHNNSVDGLDKLIDQSRPASQANSGAAASVAKP